MKQSAPFAALQEEARSVPHLRQLLKQRTLVTEHDGITLDYSRQCVTHQTMTRLLDLAHHAKLAQKKADMFAGKCINVTENRPVLHVALRAAATDQYIAAAQTDTAAAAANASAASATAAGAATGIPTQRNVVPRVHAVQAQIREFATQVRSGDIKGATGQNITSIVAIGIGGSYLGASFVADALHSEPEAKKAAQGRELRFLANVDPVGVERALRALNPANTLAIVVSKTFTTAETMLNARTVRAWLQKALGHGADVVQKHMVAVSTNVKGVAEFGINPKNTFEFWNWVGGRYSVCSAVGMLPLSLHYSPELMLDQFLAGARSVDLHFRDAPLSQNLPVLMGLLGVYNSSVLGHRARAIACYSEALCKFAPHIQQVDMESNGKSVSTSGQALDFVAGEIDFGEPGTNGQHSFFQLIHQGAVVPTDFIGFCESQHPLFGAGEGKEPVNNHDELMSNFFAQPDALANGLSAEEIKTEQTSVPAHVVPHKVMSGNRPSNVLLFQRLDAYTCGQLLSLYEHRTAVQGWIWDINSFDQFGVELGKVLGKRVRKEMVDIRSKKRDKVSEQFCPSTRQLIERYFAGSKL